MILQDCGDCGGRDDISDGDEALGVLKFAGTHIDGLSHGAVHPLVPDEKTAEQQRARRIARWNPLQTIENEGTVA